jgi:chromosome segregation ATPase
MSATDEDLRQANDKLELWKGAAQRLADRVVRQESELAEANYQIEKYAAEARQAIDAHGAAFVELAAVKQTMGELCESCGWSMRFPDQPCRCELERELASAKDALLQAHKDYGCELRDPNGTIWEHAAQVQQQRDRLERELLDLKESITSLSHPNCRDLLRELAEANEYADKLAAGYPDGMLPKDIEVLREANYEFAQEVHGLREQRDVIMQRLSETHMRMTEAEKQRDRLAEALRDLCETLLVKEPRDVTDLLNKAGDALAAVKGGTQ